MVNIYTILQEYRLKVQAERRIAESSQIEHEVKLLKQFSEILLLANSRNGVNISERVFEALLNCNEFEKDKFKVKEIDLAKENAIIYNVGMPIQNIAITAIY